MNRQRKVYSKLILEPIWSYRYNKGLLDPNTDYQVIGFGRLFGIIKEKVEDYQLRHLKLGKVKYVGKRFDNGSFSIEGISNDVAWQLDRYLAVLIRDYLRFHIKESPAIGNCILRDNPEGIPYENFFLGRNIGDVDYGKRWRDLVNRTADEFDEIRILLEADSSSQKDNEELQNKVDAAFKDLAYIYCDLNW